MLWARILADVVVVVHAAFVAFVILGLMAILIGLACRWSWVRNFWFRVLHLAAIGVVAGQALAGVICPLTILENRLRVLGGQETYPGAFIGYWAHRLIFFDAAPWVFTVCYSLFGLAVLAAFIFGPPHWPSRRHHEDKAAHKTNPASS